VEEFLSYARTILPSLLEGTLITLELSAICIVVGIIAGALLGLARVYGNKIVYRIVTVYVEVVRGTPLITQVFFIYFGLGDMGILLKPVLAAGLALAINTAAYQAEYFRGAIRAINPGQITAVMAMGGTKFDAIRYVVVPQMFRIVIPSASNEIIYMIKCTSIAFTVGVPELMFKANREGLMHFKYVETYIVAACIYIVIILVVAELLKVLERKIAIPGLGLKV
jgi:polar amino acid transport system permease protein